MNNNNILNEEYSMVNKKDNNSKRTLPMYGITGANGRLGRFALKYLLDQVPANQIIATTRQPKDLASFAAKGVNIRYADFNNPSSLPSAFSSITRLLIISSNEFPLRKRYLQQKIVVEAAVQAGVQHITNTLALLPGQANENVKNPYKDQNTNDLYQINEDDQRCLRQTLETITTNGGTWTTLNMNIWMMGVPYMLNALYKNNQLLIPEGSGKACWVTHEDYARTAVAILTGKASLKGVVNVTGPEALDLKDLALRWSDIHKQKLDIQILPGKEVVKKLLTKEMPLEMAQRFVDHCKMFGLSELMPVSDTVEVATGKPATSVDEVLKDLILK